MIEPSDLITKSAEFAQSQEEFYQRESLRLAYYAVFHLMLNKGNQLGLSMVNHSGGVHQQVISAFRTQADLNAVHLARTAHNMKRKRVKADYKLAEVITRQDVLNQQADLQYCLMLLQNL